jgi:hypothetical protein
MKAIFTFVTLLFIVVSAIGSAVLYLNDAFILSAGLHVVSFLSLSLWIQSTGMNLFNTEKA